jgi:putative hydrolase of the HAD superfamily
MVEAVLFDFGGVFTQSPFEAIRLAGDELGADPELILDVLFGPYDQDTDHPWHRLERGEIAFDDAKRAVDALARSRGLTIDPFDAFARMATTDDMVDAMVARTRKLRADGIRTAMITNNVREFGESWRTLIPVDELFDVVVDSSHAGVRKPDPAIFRLATDALGVSPHACVFLDDFPGNIIAAQTIGIDGILVGTDRHAAIAELDARLARGSPPPTSPPPTSPPPSK